MIYSLKYKNVVLNFHCQGLLILSDFDRNGVSWIILSSISGENESIFVILYIILVPNMENRHVVKHINITKQYLAVL